MRGHSPTFTLSVLLLALVGCSQAPQHAEDMAAEARAEVAAVDAPAADFAAAPQRAQAPEQGVSPDQMGSDAMTQVDDKRRFIRTASATFEVEDVYAATLAIEDEVARQGGFVVDNDIASEQRAVRTRPIGDGKRLEMTEYVLRGELTVRVPSEHTQSFLRTIASQMRFLDRRNFKAVDAQFLLLRQQLAWQRGQEAQQELGEAIDDGGKLGHRADAIQGRTAARAGRDEALIAQKEFEDRVAFSTITLALRQDVQVRTATRTDVEAVFRDHGPGFFARLGESLAVGWRGLLDVVVVLVRLWPLWLVVLAGYGAARSLRRWRRGPARAPTA